MKILVFGDFDFKEKEKVFNLLDDINFKVKITKIVICERRGAGLFAAEYADENKIEVDEIKPNFKKYGKYKAIMIRNTFILAHVVPDLTINFHTNFKMSRNNIDMTRKIFKHNIPYILVLREMVQKIGCDHL